MIIILTDNYKLQPQEQEKFFNKIELRKKEMGKRIAAERRNKHLSQAKLGIEIGKYFYSSKEDKEEDKNIISQNTISQWENGAAAVPLEKIFALADYFGCDTGYLLCDYDERVHDLKDVCSYTGLSEDSINHLHSNQQWGLKSDAHMIDLLLYDAGKRNRSHHFRPILNLLAFFFRFKNTGYSQMQVFSNGYITDYQNTDGFIADNAINLNEKIIENAVLMEIQQALTSLKETIKEE